MITHLLVADALDDGRSKRARQDPAGAARIEPARAQIEQLLAVELTDRRAMAALDVVRVDLELGLRVDLGVLAEEQVVVALLRVDPLATGLHEHAAVENATAALADDAAERLAAQGFARRVIDRRVIIDMLAFACEKQSE